MSGGIFWGITFLKKFLIFELFSDYGEQYCIFSGKNFRPRFKNLKMTFFVSKITVWGRTSVFEIKNFCMFLCRISSENFLDSRQKHRQQGRNCISILQRRFLKEVFFERFSDFLTIFFLTLRNSFANFCQKFRCRVLKTAFCFSRGTAWINTFFWN